MKPTPGNVFAEFLPCALWDDRTVCCCEQAVYFYKRRGTSEVNNREVRDKRGVLRSSGPKNKTYRCEEHRIGLDNLEWEEVTQQELIDAWEINKIMVE